MGDLNLSESARDTAAGRIDPRVKILAALAAVMIVVSEPRGEIRPFGLYIPVILAAVAVSGASYRIVLRRLLGAAPFILAASALFPLSHVLGGDAGGVSGAPITAGLSLLFKAVSSVLLLGLLTATDRLHRLLRGLRSLGLPSAAGAVLALAGRSVIILGEESARMGRARRSRTPGALRVSRIRVVGYSAAGLFLRGWKRSLAVQAAMASRGFDGTIPRFGSVPLRWGDASVFLVLIPLALIRAGF